MTITSHRIENKTMKVFGGIEGGASYSKLVFVNQLGEILCWIEGPSANYLLLGLGECQKRLHELVEKAKVEASLPKDFQLQSLSFCLSGCEQEEGNCHFKEEYLKNYPQDSESCTVASDTVGSVLTADPNGGLVLIAGTGSNSLLINPDGSKRRSGGWGHLLGDEASAIWISLRACKTVFDTEDNYQVAPYPIDCVKQSILEHFKLKDKFGLLEHCYTNFNKTEFAKLCEKLATVVNETNDPLIKLFFYEAGEALGKYVKALIPYAHKSLMDTENGLSIICVGSVFKSWHLLKDGFHAGLDSCLPKFSLFQLLKSSALGAAVLGARDIDEKIPLDFKSHSTVLYRFPEQ